MLNRYFLIGKSLFNAIKRKFSCNKSPLPILDRYVCLIDRQKDIDMGSGVLSQKTSLYSINFKKTILKSFNSSAVCAIFYYICCLPDKMNVKVL